MRSNGLLLLLLLLWESVFLRLFSTKNILGNQTSQEASVRGGGGARGWREKRCLMISFSGLRDVSMNFLSSPLMQLCESVGATKQLPNDNQCLQ